MPTNTDLVKTELVLIHVVHLRALSVVWQMQGRMAELLVNDEQGRMCEEEVVA
jgi:hypothetical protein